MNSEPLVCAVYVSHAERLMTDAELERILDISRRNNAVDDITGQLIYAGGNFIQAIEGPESRIDALLGRLKADPRHKQLVVILRWPIQSRTFGDWKMQFRRLSRADAHQVAEMLPTDNGADRSSIATRLLAEFRRGNPLD